MLKKHIPLLIVFLSILVISGCGKVKQAVTSASATPEAVESAAPTATPIAAKPTQMSLYYGNENGDDLVAKVVTLKQSSTETPYLEALNDLTKSPDSQSIALFAGFTFISAELKDDVLNIDLTLPNSSQLGAPGEELLINALKKTMFQFKEINAIEVLVNGKKVESLLGHVELSHPIKK